MKTISVLIAVLLLTGFWPGKSSATESKDKISKPTPLIPDILREARQNMARGQFELALVQLEAYLKEVLKQPDKSRLHFFAIDAIGGIKLRGEQDPDGAIRFFKSVESDPHLSDAEQDTVSGWIARAEEWKKLGKMPKDIRDPGKLFDLGKKFYSEGLKRQKFINDRSGKVDLTIASNYLIPFTVHYDRDPRIGEALYMMGDIRRRDWYDNEFWSENFYLTEVIRRFPGTPLAQKAYSALEEDVRFGYTGTSGDHTPGSWIRLLKELKSVAQTTPQQAPIQLK